MGLGIWVPGYRIFVVKDIFHHALRRVRQWSQFLLDSITTFNFSTGVLGRSFGYTLTSGRGLLGLYNSDIPERRHTLCVTTTWQFPAVGYYLSLSPQCMNAPRDWTLLCLSSGLSGHFSVTGGLAVVSLSRLFSLYTSVPGYLGIWVLGCLGTTQPG